MRRPKKGFVDCLLLDSKGFPLVVLEAKAEDKNPLVGKEQARKYARSQNCRFVTLSSGNLHYFWDLERGNPYLITASPTPDSVIGYQKVSPNPQRLIAEQVDDDYIVLTQRPSYQAEAGWRNDSERPGYIQANKLRFLRPYQLKAVHSLQAAVDAGKDRFLFEMATGTGKTALSAAKSQPTFRYSLLDGVKEGYLINPTVVDARTEITTELLSEEGFVVSFTDDTGEDQQQTFKQREFEKRFFAEATNQLFCKTFLETPCAIRSVVRSENRSSSLSAGSCRQAGADSQ